MTNPDTPSSGGTSVPGAGATPDTGQGGGRGCGARHGCGSGRRRAPLAIAFLLLVGGVAGFAATKAFSHGGFGHHMHRGPGIVQLAAGGSGPIDPAAAEARADRMARHFGVEVNATPEQQEKIAALVKAAAKDLLPLRDKAQAARKDLVDLIGATAIDKGAIERIRGEQMATADAATKRLSQAVVDIAEVLTPEQRRTLADRITAWREHRGWGWHRG